MYLRESVGGSLAAKSKWSNSVILTGSSSRGSGRGRGWSLEEAVTRGEEVNIMVSLRLAWQWIMGGARKQKGTQYSRIVHTMYIAHVQNCHTHSAVHKYRNC